MKKSQVSFLLKMVVSNYLVEI